MGGAEIIHRVGERVRQSIDRRRPYEWRQFDLPGPAPIFPGLREAILANRSAALDASLREAAFATLAGEFQALGVSWPRRSAHDLFPAMLWQLDPVTSEYWPGQERFSADIDFRHQRGMASVKYVWEINRLQFIQPLAAVYAIDRDPRVLAAIESAITSWFDANPPFRGINWNSGIELSLRALSLVVGATLCGDALSAPTQSRIRSILAATLYWLNRYPSRFSSANNHLVMEALGVFLIGAVLPDLPGAQHAREAHDVLAREAQLQIHADGVGAEQSPSYAAFVIEALLTAAMLARDLGRPFKQDLHQRLELFARWISWLSRPNGETPSIGDDDEGSVWMSLSGSKRSYAVSVAAAVAGYLGRPAFGTISSDGELRSAIFGSPRASAPEPSGILSFPMGGYTIVRESRAGRNLHLVFDHGPLGYLSIAAHGHADANAIFLAIDGEQILIDPGTFMYHAEDEWRDWFRGTRSHNTLSVGGANQSLIAGPFMWSHKAKARLEHLDTGSDWSITATHDGYRRQFGVDHCRTVAATDQGFEILDTLVPASGSQIVELAFQFAPAIALRNGDNGIVASRGGDDLLRLDFNCVGDISIEEGGERPEGGWVSPSFGCKTPAPRLCWRGRLPSNGLRTSVVLVATKDQRGHRFHIPTPEIVSSR
jgi:Heparinase II/III-like protein/Heparinase II/III N-terminus